MKRKILMAGVILSLCFSSFSLDFVSANDENEGNTCTIDNVVNDELEGLPIIEEEYDPVLPGSRFAAKPYSSYFKQAKWINRGGVWSLSIYPTEWFLLHPARMYDAWDRLKERHSSSRHWSYYKKNEGILREQFLCHVAAAGSWKVPWNIEPSKSSINWKCN